MARFDEQYAGNHRRQLSLVLVVSLSALLLAIAPRQERALFVTPGMNLSAFAATFPPINLARLRGLPINYDGGRDTPSAFFARTPPRPAGTTPFADTPAGGAGAPGDSAPAVGSASPGDVASFPPVIAASAPSPNEGGLPFGPTSSSQPDANPIAPVANATPVPVVTPTPVPTATASPVPTPVAAVPEPSTWLMLIVGLFGTGAALRARRTRRGRSSLAC